MANDDLQFIFCLRSSNILTYLNFLSICFKNCCCTVQARGRKLFTEFTMISTKLCSIILILLQIHISLELNILQQKIKDILVTSTSTSNTNQRIQMADALNLFLPKVLPQATINMIGLSDVIVEFKAQCLSGHVNNNFDEAIKWGNIAANELMEQKTLDELNALMKSIGEEQQSNEISAARHLAIHFKNKAKHIMESLTFYSEDVLEDIADVSVNAISKETKELHQWFNKRSTSV